MTTKYKTADPNFIIRTTESDDVGLILRFIRELASYENMLELVVATEDDLRQTIFEKLAAEVLIGEYESQPVAFALFFHNYSTFLGKPGLHLEDLFVQPQMRGKGLGKIMLAFLAKLAIERECGRMEWWCLDWNEPSICFYQKLGAKSMDDWTAYRVCNDDLAGLAKTFLAEESISTDNETQ